MFGSLHKFKILLKWQQFASILLFFQFFSSWIMETVKKWHFSFLIQETRTNSTKCYFIFQISFISWYSIPSSWLASMNCHEMSIFQTLHHMPELTILANLTGSTEKEETQVLISMTVTFFASQTGIYFISEKCLISAFCNEITNWNEEKWSLKMCYYCQCVKWNFGIKHRFFLWQYAMISVLLPK